MKDFDTFTKTAYIYEQFGQINYYHRLWKVTQSAISRPMWSHWWYLLPSICRSLSSPVWGSLHMLMLFYLLFSTVNDPNSFIYYLPSEGYSQHIAAACHWSATRLGDFWKFLATNCLLRVAQRFVNFLGYLKVGQFLGKIALTSFRATTGNFGLLLIPASGHAACQSLSRRRRLTSPLIL